MKLKLLMTLVDSSERGSRKMYTKTNFKTKKALKDAIVQGEQVTVCFSRIGEDIKDGIAFVEGPHFPEAHTWYAKVELRNGVIIKVY